MRNSPSSDVNRHYKNKREWALGSAHSNQKYKQSNDWDSLWRDIPSKQTQEKILTQIKSRFEFQCEYFKFHSSWKSVVKKYDNILMWRNNSSNRLMNVKSRCDVSTLFDRKVCLYWFKYKRIEIVSTWIYICLWIKSIVQNEAHDYCDCFL